MPPAGPAPVPRPTVRVLLVDERDRVLLLRMQALDGSGPLWFTVGGGINPGESARQAARREVREETGLADVDLGPEVLRHRHQLSLDGVRYELRERYYLARVTGFAADAAGCTAWERAHIEELRWWPVQELATTGERLFPPALAGLATRLAAQRHGGAGARLT